MDAYGPVAHIGGGALSGKGHTRSRVQGPDQGGPHRRVCRRWVAKSIVNAGLAKRCEVQIAYAIGRETPVSVDVETFGTGLVPDEVLCRVARQTFDLRPAALIRELKLRRPMYAPLAVYGHFGRTDVDTPWRRRRTTRTRCCSLPCCVRRSETHGEMFHSCAYSNTDFCNHPKMVTPSLQR